MPQKTEIEATLIDLRNALPYQYAAIIKKKLNARENLNEVISNRQIRDVISEKIENPAIVLPVLEEAWNLYEETKRATALKQKKPTGASPVLVCDATDAK